MCGDGNYKISPGCKSGSLTESEILQACKNIGYDLKCGFCAAIFYTGVVLPGDVHDLGCETNPKLKYSQPEVLIEVG